MNGQYIEVLIKREPMIGLNQMKTVCKFAALAAFLLGIVSGKLYYFALALISIIVYNFKLVRMDVEFEYYYLNGELEISQVFSKAKRKSVITLEARMIEQIAPAEAEVVQRFGTLQQYDCTSQDPDDTFYAVIYRDNGTMKKVLINKDDELLRAFRLQMPGKVVL